MNIDKFWYNVNSYKFRIDKFNPTKLYQVKKSKCYHYYVREFILAAGNKVSYDSKWHRVRKHIYYNIIKNSTLA